MTDLPSAPPLQEEPPRSSAEIFLVQRVDYDYTILIAAFSARSDAEAFVARAPEADRLDIQIAAVVFDDPDPSGCYSAQVGQNGDRRVSWSWMERPGATRVFTHYNSTEQGCSATGATPDAAFALAEETLHQLTNG